MKLIILLFICVVAVRGDEVAKSRLEKRGLDLSSLFSQQQDDEPEHSEDLGSLFSQQDDDDETPHFTEEHDFKPGQLFSTEPRFKPQVYYSSEAADWKPKLYFGSGGSSNLKPNHHFGSDLVTKYIKVSVAKPKPAVQEVKLPVYVEHTYPKYAPSFTVIKPTLVTYTLPKPAVTYTLSKPAVTYTLTKPSVTFTLAKPTLSPYAVYKSLYFKKSKGQAELYKFGSSGGLFGKHHYAPSFSSSYIPSKHFFNL